ncbi:redoxin domain-containing protein, partial [bacterium]|nr:redoxin domain-containing protein [bacterium]
FWATWCAPCRRTIPHLNALHQRYRTNHVTIVGVTSETKVQVAPYLEAQGTNMTYAVALDNRGETTEAYMEAYGARGIPHAFVVDAAGRIVWQGHPLAGLDETVEQLVAGTFSLEEAQRAAREQRDAEQAGSLVGLYLYVARVTKEPDLLKAVSSRILSRASNSAPVLASLAGGIVYGEEMKVRDNVLALDAARRADTLAGGTNALFLGIHGAALYCSGEKDAARKLLARAVALAGDPGEKAELGKTLDRMNAGTFGDDTEQPADKAQKLMRAYFHLAAEGADETLADLFAGRIFDYGKTDVSVMNETAWQILDNEELKHRDLAFALKAAKAALDLSGGTRADVLDTYARALYANSNFTEAVEYQQEAVSLADDELKPALEKTLKAYQDAAKKQDAAAAKKQAEKPGE